jgi:hypothetical protein
MSSAVGEGLGRAIAVTKEATTKMITIVGRTSAKTTEEDMETTVAKVVCREVVRRRSDPSVTVSLTKTVCISRTCTSLWSLTSNLQVCRRVTCPT